jgi:uncharacterized protein YdeI (YjbR/CyaY-like superfamily)
MRGEINVKGEINGVSFNTCLFPSKAASHILLVNKKMQKAAGVREGATADFVLERDSKKRVATTLDSLKRILDGDRTLRLWYDGLNQSTRNDIATWVNDPKGEDARARRTDQIAGRLLAVMDAEREIPPILQVAFARSPQARAAWEKCRQPNGVRTCSGFFTTRRQKAACSGSRR